MRRLMLFGLWVLISAGAIAIAWTGVSVVDSEAVDPPPVVVSQQGETTEVTIAVEDDGGTTEVAGQLLADETSEERSADGAEPTADARGLRQFNSPSSSSASGDEAPVDGEDPDGDDASGDVDDPAETDEQTESDDAQDRPGVTAVAANDKPQSSEQAIPTATPTPEPTSRPAATPVPTARPTSTPIPTPTFTAFSVGSGPRPTATNVAAEPPAANAESPVIVVAPTSTAVPPTATPVPPTPVPPTPVPTATPLPPTPTPTPEPTPTPAPPTPTPTPVSEVITAASIGGAAAFEVSSTTVSVLWASPNEEFSVTIDNDGDEASVRFESPTHLSRIEVWWNGVPRWVLKETPKT